MRGKIRIQFGLIQAQVSHGPILEVGQADRSYVEL